MEELFMSDDLILEIVIRLPVKAIYRSNCVCKRWEYLISSDPLFARRMKSLPPLMSGFFYFDYQQDKMRLFHVGGSHDIASDLGMDTSIAFVGCPVYVLDSRNGFLLCVEKPPSQDSDLEAEPCWSSFRNFVCNPFTKQWIALPKRNYELCRDTKNALLYCYGKDVSKREPFGQFKVIDFAKHTKEFIEIETYSSETGEWRLSVISEPNCNFNSLHGIRLIGNIIYIWDHDQTSGRFCTYNLHDISVCYKELPLLHGPGRGAFWESAGCVKYVASSSTGIYEWALNDGIEWSLVYNIPHDCLIDQLPSFPYRYTYNVLLYLPLERMLLLYIWRESNKCGVFWYHKDTRKIDLVHPFKTYYGCPFVPYALQAWFPLARRKSSKELKTKGWFTLLLSLCCFGKKRSRKFPNIDPTESYSRTSSSTSSSNIEGFSI